MKMHWGFTLVVLIIGYVVGVKFPQLAAKVGI